MNVIRFFARNARSKLLVAVAAGIVSGLSSMVLFALFGSVLKGGSRYSASTLACILLGLCLFLPLTRFISEVVLLRLAQAELFTLRMRLSRRILQSALRHLEILGSEPLMATLTSDIPEIVDSLHLLPLLCLNVAIALSGFVYLGLLSWRILLLVLGFFVLGLLLYELPSRLSMKHFRAARQELDLLWGHFKDLTEGVKELKLHSRRRHAFLSQVLRGTAAAQSKHMLSAFNFHGMANSLGQMLVFAAIGLILFWATGSHSGIAVPAGSIITLLYITSALQFVMNSLPSIARADIALQKVESLTRQLEGPGVMELQRDVPTHVGLRCERLTLKAITHAYHSKQAKEAFTLGPIDINLNAGELVLVAGGNGSGKTTLAKIITGLYPAETGELLLNGQPITDDNRELYRQHFSAVFYDFYLFESLLGLEKPDLDEDARERLARLQLDHAVTIKNGVLSTTQLSQGQRKRLALLTATLEDRPIYVFDEWAADQDPEFKDFFYRELLSDLKAKGKLVLVICHDDHYFDVADRMIKLESGRIIYDGLPAAAAS
jgi:putative pyoverdin transport system ATP-binding/permease protein